MAPKFADEFRKDDFAAEQVRVIPTLTLALALALALTCNPNRYPNQLGDMLYAQTKTQLGANLGLFPAWDRGVRYYVSSVAYGGG